MYMCVIQQRSAWNTKLLGLKAHSLAGIDYYQNTIKAVGLVFKNTTCIITRGLLKLMSIKAVGLVLKNKTCIITTGLLKLMSIS